MKIKRLNVFILFFMFLNTVQNVEAKIELISYRSWDYCYKISNKNVEIIINPAYGGHILYYGLKNLNSNSLWADSTINGYTIEKYRNSSSGKKTPDSGRFDIGNERLTQKIHDISWEGSYSVRIVNDYSVIVTSYPSKESGIQLSREYTLDNEGSHLIVKQTMENISTREVKYCHWSRSLLPSGGVYITQIVKTSKYPKGFAQFLWSPDRIDKENPSTERISIVNDTIFVAQPDGNTGVKYGMMTTSGWCCYVNNNMMFMKRFDLYPNGEYDNNLKAEFPNMIYFDKRFIEIEPNSAMVKLKPGNSNSYSENWWLLNYPEKTDNTFDIMKAFRYAKKKVLN